MSGDAGMIEERWSELHSRSEQLAAAAHEAARAGDSRRSEELFADAARLEEDALHRVGAGNPRTYGVTAVSAVALWAKSGNVEQAERLAAFAITKKLPPFAVDQLCALLHELKRRRDLPTTQ